MEGNKQMTKEERARAIKSVCDKAGCSDKRRELHYDVFVNQGWQPHVSQRFRAWWFEQGEFKSSLDEKGIGISQVSAQNVARIWAAYLDAKEIGLA
jgi:hypothetical protein